MDHDSSGAHTPPRPGVRPSIRLRLEISTAASLKEVRISILDFIKATCYLHSHTNVGFLLVGHKNGKTYTEEFAIATRNMRRSCFVLLTELLRTQPEKTHLKHPEILINGWGVAVEAVYSGLGVVKEVYKSSQDFKNAEMSHQLRTKDLARQHAKYLYNHFGDGDQETVLNRSMEGSRYGQRVQSMFDTQSRPAPSFLQARTLAGLCRTLRDLDSHYYLHTK